MHDKIKKLNILYSWVDVFEMFNVSFVKMYLGTQSKVYGGAFFVKIVNYFYPLTIFAKKLHHRYSNGF